MLDYARISENELLERVSDAFDHPLVQELVERHRVLMWAFALNGDNSPNARELESAILEINTDFNS